MNKYRILTAALSSKATVDDLRFAGLLTYSCLLAFPPYYIYRQWREWISKPIPL